ncbi:MAG: DEAD/DEAH box helicase family protein, partial [Gillisia sp.]
MNHKPFEIKLSSNRWAPAQDQVEAVNQEYEKLLPPLVHKVREGVEKWRDAGYPDVSQTTRTLLNFWFNDDHTLANGENFQFYFAQRESIESIIYLYEVAEARDKYELIRYDSSGRVSTNMFDESWARYVVKMATGTGKTKVLGLALVWSYFNALYEQKSDFS